MWSAPATKTVFAKILEKVEDKILRVLLCMWNHEITIVSLSEEETLLVMMRNSMESDKSESTRKNILLSCFINMPKDRNNVNFYVK